jgi:peptide/nickel transport system substrate-binding protein
MRKLHYAILSTFLFLGGCKSKESDANRQVFRYNQESDISSLDPAFARDQANIWAVNQLYNGLIQLNPQLIPIPSIAKKWDILDAGKLYRFYLRTDVTFHESPLFENPKRRKVTAYDFVYSFSRIIDPEVASPGAWIFNDKVDSKTPFTAVNDSVFEIRLKQAFPPFLGILSMHYCSVVPKEVVNHYGKDFREHPIGTGPFKFAFWEPQETLVLHRNDSYFEVDSSGNSLPFLDAVQVSFLPDKQAAFLAFKQGKIDFISGIDPSFKDDVLTKDGALQSKYTDKMILQKSPYLNTEYLGILMDGTNQSKALSNKLTRQAMNFAIDRNSMMRFLRNNVGTPGTAGFIPPGLPGFDSSSMYNYAYNPELAQKLLAKAGYNKSTPIVLSTTPSYIDLAVFVQKELQKVGINIKIETLPGPTLRQLINKSEASFFRGSWIADYPDAENYLSLFYSKNFAPNGPNYTHFKNQDFDLLFDKAINTTDDDLRIQLYKEMDSIIRQEAPVVVLFYDQVFRLVNSSIVGLESNPLNLLDLKRVKKLPKN